VLGAFCVTKPKKKKEVILLKALFFSKAVVQSQGTKEKCATKAFSVGGRRRHKDNMKKYV